MTGQSMRELHDKITDYQTKQLLAICKECEKDEYYTGCDADRCTIWLLHQGYNIEEIDEKQDFEE